MSDQAVKKEGWGSAFGFVITSIGYAVGLGAIWKFPYMIGMNGGGVFLLICFVLIITVAVPLCWAELTLGRYTQKSVIVGMRELDGKGSPWVVLGWTGLAACTILASYYITIVSDVMFYIFRFATGGLSGMSMEDISLYYSSLQIDMVYKFGTVALLYVLTVLVLMGGIQKGLERANKILIPALFLFLLILGIRGLMLPGGIDGVVWMFTPDWSRLNGSVIMSALNQCFFFSGVAMATLFAFGSYLDRENSDIPFSGSVIVLSNLVVAALAGTAIFSSLFAYNMDVTSGSGLVFQTLPYIFCDMPGGMVWGTLFFILLFAAGWSSLLGLYEGAASVIVDSYGFSRKKSLLIITVVMFVLSIPTILSTTVWADVRPLGMDLFTFMDFVTLLIAVPIGAVMISLYVGTKFWDRFLQNVNIGAKYFRIPSILRIWYIAVLPLITVLVMIFGIKSYF